MKKSPSAWDKLKTVGEDIASIFNPSLRKKRKEAALKQSEEAKKKELVDGIYEKNDIDYLLKQGYTLEDAKAFLATDPKYAAKQTSLEKKMSDQTIDVNSVQAQASTAVSKVADSIGAVTPQSAATVSTVPNAAGSLGGVDYTEKFDIIISLLSTIANALTGGESGTPTPSNKTSVALGNKTVSPEIDMNVFANIARSMNNIAANRRR